MSSFLNCSSDNLQELEDELNILLVSKGARSGYFRYGKKDIIQSDKIPSNIKCINVKHPPYQTRINEYMKRPRIIYYNPDFVTNSDVEFILEKGWDENDLDVGKALGRLLGYKYPGVNIKDGYVISYDVILPGGNKINIYGEHVPKDYDKSLIKEQTDKIREIINELYPGLKFINSVI